MSRFYDELETRSMEEREAQQFSLLREQLVLGAHYSALQDNDE